MDSTDRKHELHHYWQIEENLLQLYRTFGLSTQALLYASALVISTTLHSGFDAMRGALRHMPPFPNATVSYLLLWVILCVILSVGWISLRAIKRIAGRREGLVTLYQNLLVREEKDLLAAELSAAGLADNPRFFIAGKICDLDPRIPADKAQLYRCFSNVMPETAWAYFNDRFRSADATADLNKGGTRSYFSARVFRHFGVLWACAAAYAVLVLYNLIA